MPTDLSVGQKDFGEEPGQHDSMSVDNDGRCLHYWLRVFKQRRKRFSELGFFCSVAVPDVNSPIGIPFGTPRYPNCRRVKTLSLHSNGIGRRTRSHVGFHHQCSSVCGFVR